MKKFCYILFAIIIVGIITFISFVCMLNNGGESNTDEPPVIPPIEQTQTTSEFNFKMERINGMHYPVIEGYILSEVMPEDVSLTVFNGEYDIRLTVERLDDGKYKCSFFEQISTAPAVIQAGVKYVAKLNVVMQVTFEKYNYETSLEVAEDYYKESAVNLETGEIITGYTKDSDWVGPY